MTESELKSIIRAEAGGFGEFSSRWSRIEGRLDGAPSPSGKMPSALPAAGPKGGQDRGAAVRHLKFFKIFLYLLRKIGRYGSS